MLNTILICVLIIVLFIVSYLTRGKVLLAIAGIMGVLVGVDKSVVTLKDISYLLGLISLGIFGLVWGLDLDTWTPNLNKKEKPHD